MESMISTNHCIKGRLNHSTSDDEVSSWDLYSEDDSLFPFSASETSSDSDNNDNNNNNNDGSRRVSATPSQGICGRFSVNKRRKIKAGLVDEELEDTASSPDHTPKANNFNHLLYMNYFKAMATTPTTPPIFKDEGESNELGGKGSNEGDTHELRKKGLCLIPLSLFFDNYYVS